MPTRLHSRSSALVVAICTVLCVLCASTAHAQPKPPSDDKASEKAGGEQSFRLPGAEEPLRISARYADKKTEGNVELFVASGSVYAWQGDRRYPTLQLTCESLVVWQTVTSQLDPKTKQPIKRTEFYAERNVRFQRKREILFGQRMYFDLDANVALIDRARYQARISSDERLIPLVMRARRFRVLSSKRSLAQDAYFSTSKFGDPSYRFQASNIRIDVDQKSGVVRTLHSRSKLRMIEPRDNTDFPLWFFPYLALNKDEDFPLKEFEIGSSGRFGTFVFTRWGQRIGDWGSWFLDLDFSTDRGIGFGPGVEYDAEDRLGNPYRGRLLTYVINDELEGDDSTTEESGTPVDEDLRYRFNWRHRHELPKKLRLDLELSVISDRNFLREFFEDELREEKEKETIAYLRKQKDNHQASILLKYELNDFVTTTEYFPQVRFDTLHEPLKDTSKWLRNVYYTGAHQASFMRRRFDQTERTRVTIDPESGEEVTEVIPPEDDETAARFDSNNQLAYPFRLGAFGFYPSLGIRPGAVSSDGGTFSARGDLRVTTQLSRLYRVRIPSLGVNNLMHVINPEIRYANIFVATPDPEDRVQFDEVDSVGRFHVLTFKLLNRLKTRRFDLPKHSAARYPARKKPAEETIAFGRKRQGSIVEVLFFDMELPIYPEADRDNEGRTIGDLKVDGEWSIREWWRLTANAEIRLDGSSSPDRDREELEEELPEEDREEALESAEEIDEEDEGAGLRIFNIATSITSRHTYFPRWALTVGNRYARDVSNTLFFDGRLSVNRKWEVGVRLEYDTMDSRLDTGELRLRRYFDRIVVDFEVERNEGDVRGDDETEFKIRVGLRALEGEDDRNAEDFDDDVDEDDDEDQGTLLGGLGVTTDEEEEQPAGKGPKPKALDPRNSGGR